MTSLVLPKALGWYALTSCSLWCFSLLPLLFHATRHIYAERLWYYPQFYDFGCYLDRIRLLHTPAFWTGDAGPSWDYPAPGIFVYKLFYAFNRGSGDGPHKVFYGFLAYLVFSTAVLCTLAVTLTRKLHRNQISWLRAAAFSISSVFFCWPIFFCLQRGNIELFIDAGIGVGLWAFFRKRWIVAAVLLGAFGSAKLYPLVLLLLFLPERKWKELALAVGTALAVTIVSAHYIGPAPLVAGESHGLLHGLQDWVRANSFQIDVHRSGYDHSMYGALKLLNLSRPDYFARLAAMYAVITTVVCIVIFATRFFRVPRLNQLLLLGVAAVLLPPTSFDYTLQLLVPAWVLAVLLGSRQKQSHAPAWLLVLFAVLFAPETFVSLDGVMLAGQVKTLALLAIALLAMIHPLHEAEQTV